MKEQKDEKGSVLDSLRNLARPLDNDETYCFYSGFIPPLIQVLPNEKDRDFAQIWLKKLDSEDEGPNRINYVLLLNYALQRGKLLTPFDRSPPPGKLSKIDNVLEWIILYEKANKDKGCGTQSLSSNRRKFTNDASSYDKTSSPNTYNIGEEKVDDRFIVNSISSGKAPVLSRSTPQDSLQQPKARMEAGGSVLKSPKKVRASLSAQRLPRGGSSKRRSRERERGRGSKSLTKSDGKSSPKLVASKSYVKSKANVNESEDSKSISIHVDIHLEFDKCNEAEKIAQVLPIKSNSKSRNTKRLQGSGRDSIGNSEKLKFTSIMKNLDSEEKEFKAKSETDKDESSPSDLQSAVLQSQDSQQVEKSTKQSEECKQNNERISKSSGSKNRVAKRSVSEKSLRSPNSSSSQSFELRTTFSESKVSDLAPKKPENKTTQTALNFHERANPSKTWFEPESKVTQTTSSLGELILRSKTTFCDADSQDVQANLRFEEHISGPERLAHDSREERNDGQEFSEPSHLIFNEGPSRSKSTPSRSGFGPKDPTSRITLARSSSRLTSSGSALFCAPVTPFDQDNQFSDETVVTPVVRLLILQLEEMKQTYDTYAEIMSPGNCSDVNKSTCPEHCPIELGKHRLDKHHISRVVRNTNRPLLSPNNIILKKFPNVNPSGILSKGDVNILMREFERMVDSYNYFTSMLSKIACKKDCKMDLGRKRVDFRIVKPPKLTHGDLKVLLEAFERMLSAYEKFTESLACKDPKKCEEKWKKLNKHDRKHKGEDKRRRQENECEQVRAYREKCEKKKINRQRGGQYEHQIRDYLKNRDSGDSSSDRIPHDNFPDGWNRHKFPPHSTRSRCHQCFSVLKKKSADISHSRRLPSNISIASGERLNLGTTLNSCNASSVTHFPHHRVRQVAKIPLPDSCKLVFNVSQDEPVVYFFEFETNNF